MMIDVLQTLSVMSKYCDTNNDRLRVGVLSTRFMYTGPAYSGRSVPR